jgi:hypothetical protein
VSHDANFVNIHRILSMSCYKLRKLEDISSKVKSKSSAGAVLRFFERDEDESDLCAFSQNLKMVLDGFQVLPLDNPPEFPFD